MSVQQQLSARLAQSPLWQRWQAMPARDRSALAALGLFVLAALLYVGVWQPARQALQEARGYYQEQRQLNAYLEQNADLARQLSGTEQPTLAPEQLQGVVTQSAQDQGLRVESFENASDGAVVVKLPAAPSAALLDWLARLQTQGVRLDEANLQRIGDGLVNASLTLRAGS